MLRFKPIPSSGEFALDVCAVSRCSAEAVIIDATLALAPCRVPLCEHHWERRCALERELVDTKAVVVAALRRRNQRKETQARYAALQTELPLFATARVGKHRGPAGPGQR